MVHDWDNYAAHWEKDQANLEFSRQVFQQLKTMAPLDGKHILDFGCGTGLLSQHLSPLCKDIVALDKSEAMIEELDKKELANVEPVVDHLTRGLVAQHPAFRKQFDFVLAVSVCGYLSNFQEVADIAYTLLDEGGQFILWDWSKDNVSLEYGLSDTEIVNVLTRSGFARIDVAHAFDIQTPQGIKSVLVGLGQK
ncbi:methyltransferase [Vibrio cincinnatiensis]|uniref:Methyltransferase domain-containing protein n=1 Tax=Vibrio cincinnatiensis DSM 19608 TaxID=1123491 RepID=A0A1T4P0G3_VIBCI|nr:methyltransferase domain-containing protein [Vibrio cincinnatiensis]MCG3723477.1 methyltransferase [Vibrio cincinnatiensis]MCG3726664.1 methyltransferase [Vibrio cincinnatiensis]MCG3733880.1 methyltransferase [Vibrio cincinnatiensis]MCG3741097.1 methyltransferase [Vibrio cincinnatiensis]MCG3744659.1 methyltransferase [Vibrio cincinnatiensis]